MKAEPAETLPGSLTKMKAKGRMKPSLMIHASMDTPMDHGGHDWRKDDIARLEGEIAAIKKQLDGFDHVKAGKEAERSLRAEHALKKARLQEHKAHLKYGHRGFF